MKQKMDPAKKLKLIYSIELIAIACIFIVVGILKLCGVIGQNSTYRFVFNIVTSVGACLIIGDLIWGLVSKKRRKKICLMDKLLALPAVAYLIVYNILCFCAKGNVLTLPNDFYSISMASVIFYLSANYIFQGIYHYFYPIPEILIAMEEERLEAEKKQKELEEKLQQEVEASIGKEEAPKDEEQQ